MIHYHSLQEAQSPRESVVTIGVFDGVHRGHQHLIRQLTAQATSARQSPVVLTFYPYPDMVIRGFEPGYCLTLPERKAELLGGLGVEAVVTHPFSDEVRHIRATAFVDLIIERLSMASLWVGADFAMGYKREGDIGFLNKLAAERGFELRVIDLMDADGERVSSSRIRNSLKAGDVQEAARLLGRPHRVSGRVVHGDGRGGSIGIHTANLEIPVEQAIPARGVYAAQALTSDSEALAVVNIGVRPTFDGSGALTVEAHLLDFSGNLYDTTLSIDFVTRLRDEQKFSGVEALVAQIHRDIDAARVKLSSA